MPSSSLDPNPNHSPKYLVGSNEMFSGKKKETIEERSREREEGKGRKRKQSCLFAKVRNDMLFPV